MKWWVKSLWVFLTLTVLNLFDAASTWFALKTGATEGNPIFSFLLINPLFIYLFKVGVPLLAFLSLSGFWLYKDKDASDKIAFAFILTFLYVVLNNFTWIMLRLFV